MCKIVASEKSLKQLILNYELNPVLILLKIWTNKILSAITRIAVKALNSKQI
jgi:hypothetical protein